MADENGKKAAPGRAYGLVAVGLGLLAIVLASVAVMNKFESAADVGAVLGVVVGPIATIVAAYFGVQAGAAGKEAADKNAQAANDRAIAIAATAEAGPAGDALRALLPAQP